ncbi:MAG: PqqD family protein [Planctomycetes bacterium]|nr:PqqD family protein [Planctomycetota bacterium]
MPLRLSTRGKEPPLACFWTPDAGGDRGVDLRASAFARGLEDLRLVSEEEALDACSEMAGRLREVVGEEGLSRASFVAVPRGGIIVLGWLSYILPVRAEQLMPGASREAPLVVIVDDCAYTGYRIGRFLDTLGVQKTVVATLFSAPGFRRAIVEREPRVTACVAARDLADAGEGPGADGKRHVWLERLSPPRYWAGVHDHVVFPWSEPERILWDAEKGCTVRGWPLVPPEMLLGGRRADAPGVVVYHQPEGRGPLRPSESCLFYIEEGLVLIADRRSREVYELTGDEVFWWRSLLEHGSVHGMTADLAERLGAPKEALRPEVAAFLDDLVARGLVGRVPASEA